MRSRRGAATFDWISCVGAALRLPVLQRRQAVAVDADIHVGRVRVEALADDQARLAMRIAPVPIQRMSAASETSPDARFQTKWNASLVDHMFSPPPATR